jgi:hypothetical protein
MSVRETKLKQTIAQVAQTAALERALARRERDIEAVQSFLQKIERTTIRRAARIDRLAVRAGFEEWSVPRVVEAGARKLSAEIRQLPQSGRALTRLRRDEARAVLVIIRKLIRRQARLNALLAKEGTWRRQLKRRLATANTVLPLLHAGNLDRLEEFLARRRGKGGANRAARMLGCLRAEKHPYSKEHYSALGVKGAARRWARVRGEKDDGEGNRGTTNGTGGAGREGCDAGNGLEN